MSLHDGHRQRTKEEFLSRAEDFPDHKVLEVMLYFSTPRKDTNPLAHELLEHFGSMAGLLDAEPDEIKKVPGAGDQTVFLLKAAKELGRRYLKSRSEPVNVVNTFDDLVRIFSPYFYGCKNERCYVACLDGKRSCIGVRLLQEGNVNTTAITYRKVLEAALSMNATAVVIAHNHPTGHAEASEADEQVTDRLTDLLGLMGICLIDHLVFGESTVTSMLSDKMLFLAR